MFCYNQLQNVGKSIQDIDIRPPICSKICYFTNADVRSRILGMGNLGFHLRPHAFRASGKHKNMFVHTVGTTRIKGMILI
jgi:hypothetical protein